MKYLLTLTLLGILIAGCASQPDAPQSAKDLPPDNPDIANIAPEGRATGEAAASEPASTLPVMTVKSPPILLTPIQGNTPEPSTENSVPSGTWPSFASSALGVVVNYPPDWSAAEDTDGATFTSSAGGIIQMKEDTANANNKEVKTGNQYCTSRTNEQGLTADICVNNASFTYTAKFTLQKADGSTHWVTLLTKTRSAGDVFEAMFNSLQSAS